MAHSSTFPDPWRLLRCPACRSELAAPPEGAAELTKLGCATCDATYPVVLGIPLLTTDSEAWRGRWCEGLGSFVAQMNFTEKQLLVELLEQSLTERTRTRVSQVVQGIAQHRDEVTTLLGRGGIIPQEPRGGADEAAAYSPETYFTLIHRDYGWAPELDEVAVSWERLQQVLPQDFKPGRTLMLGAGTGRLAWQVAASFGDPSPVLAIDINPLPFLVTALLLAGERVDLTELPAHARRSNLSARTRTLSCPLPPPPNLKLILGDGLEPPVATGVFDTVITPWFVDQVPKDAATIPPLVASLLREGGSYICTGPFLYDARHTKASRRYCADEYIEQVGRAGFVVTRATYQTEPYVASPLSTQGRIEHVLYMHAQKQGSPVVHEETLPPYLVPGSGAALAIPRPEGLSQLDLAPPEVAAVAALIDGKRSVLAITGTLVERGVLADDGTADAAVRACLKLILKALGRP